MASSSDQGGKGAQPQVDPKVEFGQTVQQLLMNGLAGAESIDTSEQVARQKWMLDQQYNQAMAAADMAKIEQDAQLKRQQHLQKVRSQGVQAKQKLEVAKAKQAAAARPTPPHELVDQALAGTETKTFRPQAPTSTGPADVAGSEAMRVLAQVTGGRGVQQQTTSPTPNAAAPLAPTQAPNSVQMGGQTFQAPAEITQRVNSLGVRPVATPGTVFNMPTFEAQTVTTPNVLSAAQVAELSARQQELVLEKALELGRDSEAPMDKLIPAADAYYKRGDMSQLQALGKQYPSISRELAKQELRNRQANYELIRSETRRSAAAAQLDEARAALWELQTTGAVGSTNWRQALSLGGGGRFTMGARGPSLGGGQGDGGYAKLSVKDIYNEKTRDLDPAAFDQYQLLELENSGRLAYKADSGPLGKLPFVGGDAGPIAYVDMNRLAGAFATLKDPNVSPEDRKAAREFLDSLPFMDVRPGKDGSPTISYSDADDPTAADIARRTAVMVENYYRAGVPPEEFMTQPGGAAKETPAEPSVTYTPTTTATGKGYSGKGPVFGEPAAKQNIERLKNFFSRERRHIGDRAVPAKPVVEPKPPPGPARFDVSQPPPMTSMPAGGIPPAGPQLTEGSPVPPPGVQLGPIAQPVGPIGPAGRALTAQEVMMLRGLGFPLEVIHSLPAEVVGQILGAAQARQMPPQIRALVPRGMFPPYPPPPSRAR